MIRICNVEGLDLDEDTKCIGIFIFFFRVINLLLEFMKWYQSQEDLFL